MSMADLAEALALIQAHQDDAHFVGPREEGLITAAETALGITFPPLFRRFISELGAGGIGSEETYGVISDNFTSGRVPNGIWLTLRSCTGCGAGALPRGMGVASSIGLGTDWVGIPRRWASPRTGSGAASAAGRAWSPPYPHPTRLT